MSTTVSSPALHSHHLRSALGVPVTTERVRWRHTTRSVAAHHPGAAPVTDLVADLAASMFLSLFVTSVGSAQTEVPLADLASAVTATGPRGVSAAGPGGVVLLACWERAGLIDPVGAGDTTVSLRPRGVGLLTGPFRWDRLTRALSRQSW